MPTTHKAQLQELYRELDHTTNGNTYLAYYGQLRAEEHSHREAIDLTLDHFHIRDTDWWKARQDRLPR